MRSRTAISGGSYVVTIVQFTYRLLNYPQIYDVNTNKPAIFSHAVRFAESHDPETGNFVPPGQRAPPGVEPKVV